ncbi:MAG: hypothetical protein LAO55_03065 [Acidobacteriia bacterium]|nr:hypothetical protein [Terriglobia bacterium]
MPRVGLFIVLALTSAVSAAINDPVRVDTGMISGPGLTPAQVEFFQAWYDKQTKR